MGMNKILLILLLSVFSHSAFSAVSCSDVFVHPVRTIIKLYHPEVTRALSYPDAMVAFGGITGYIWIAHNYFNRDMRKTYITVRRILGRKKFKQLEWKFFNGTVTDYASKGNFTQF